MRAPDHKYSQKRQKFPEPRIPRVPMQGSHGRRGRRGAWTGGFSERAASSASCRRRSGGALVFTLRATVVPGRALTHTNTGFRRGCRDPRPRVVAQFEKLTFGTRRGGECHSLVRVRHVERLNSHGNLCYVLGFRQSSRAQRRWALAPRNTIRAARLQNRGVDTYLICVGKSGGGSPGAQRREKNGSFCTNCRVPAL